MPIATDVTTSSVRQLSDGNSVGTILGQNPGDPIGFYGLSAGVPRILQGTLAGANGALNFNAVSSSPTSVLANSTSEKSFTVVGVAATDVVVAAVKPTSQAGLAVGSARVSAANTIQLSFANVTAGNLTPTTTETYLFATVPASMAFSAVLSPAAVAGSTTVEQAFTVPGVRPNMVVSVNKPTLQAGLIATGARVISNDLVGITFLNATAATVITPTAGQTYSFFAAQALHYASLMDNLAVSLTPVSVAANETAEQTFTVPGLASGQPVKVTAPMLPTGLALVGARVSAANTLALNYANVTAGALTPPPAVYQVGYFPNSNDVPSAGANVVENASVGTAANSAMATLGLIGS